MTNMWIVRFLGDVAYATSLEGAELAVRTLREDHNERGIPQGAQALIVGPVPSGE